MLTYQTIQELCQAAEAAGSTISQVILAGQAQQLGLEEREVYDRMAQRLQVMKESVQTGLDPALRSASGLSGGDAAKLLAYARTGGICGSFVSEAIARAVATSECNAAMGKIVAAPTAGSCGILPGAVLSVLEAGQCSEEQAVMALFTAGGIGAVISNRATLAGAAGRLPRPVGPRLRHRPEEPAGTGVRPGGRAGGGPLHQAERGGGDDRPRRR